MSTTPADVPYVPTFSAHTRTVVYVVCLVLSVLTGLVCTLLVAFDLLDLATGGVIIGAVGITCGAIGNGFGVAYRPTRYDISDSGVPIGRHAR